MVSNELASRPHCMVVLETAQVEGGYVPSMVFEGVAGHSPLGGNGPFARPWVWGPSLEEAKEQARKWNEGQGISEERAAEIFLSSMVASFRK